VIYLKIGLIDVDGHNFPNLALMKISTYHKAKGDQVEWCNPIKSLDQPYDVVYQSKIFDNSPEFNTYINTPSIVRGGRAYDKKLKLPDHIESMCPDYSLYNIVDEAYGYLTRGCPRGCLFCDVINIEGKISHKVADLSQFWNGEKSIKLLDPNTLASKDRIGLLRQLIESKAWVDFTQGLDIRFVTEEITDLIKQIKVKMIHFAWDGEKDTDLIINNLEAFKKFTRLDYRKLAVYVLTNFNTEIEFDLFRVYKLKDMGYDPYVMVYDKEKFVNKDGKMKPMEVLLKTFTHDQIKHFKAVHRMQRRVNNKIIWHSGELETEQAMKKSIGV
jgi:hypothetical protein